MGQDQEGKTDWVALLFNDAAKNFSDLKSRQWTATNLSVAAIAALGFSKTNHPRVAALLMFLIVVCHLVVTSKCETNLSVFRERLKALVKVHLPSAEANSLFKDDPEFQSVVVDEGRISFILYASSPIAFLCTLFVLFPIWASFKSAVLCACSR
jgi:hypothetical protein